MKIAILKYNAGNIRSVAFCLNRLGIQPEITNHPEELSSADKIIFPGVGEAKTTMDYLRDKKLDKLIVNLKQPVLGICLGMQLLCRHSEENDTLCLNVIPVEVKKFTTQHHEKIPHMGWNEVRHVRPWIGEKIVLPNEYMYFVHSYYVPLNEYTSAETEYIRPFSAMMRYKNFYTAQFHPEKSSKAGADLLEFFLTLS